MTETLVKFETALLAKEKGFDEECICTYDAKGIKQEFDDPEYIAETYSNLEDYLIVINSKLQKIGEEYNIKPCIAAPSQSSLQKWLRDSKDVHVQVKPIFSHIDNEIVGYTMTIRNKKIATFLDDTFSVYEEALEFGLIASLKLL